MTAPSASSSQAPPTRQPARPRARQTGAAAFLGVLAVGFAAYTWLAMDLDWRDQAGRIGAGFFPRVIGTLGTVLATVAALRALRTPPPDDPPADPLTGGAADLVHPEGGRHPWTLAGAVAAAAALLLFVLVPLGAVPASALFTFVLLRLLGRGPLLGDLVLSVSIPLALYLLLEAWLEAGLPAGVLPLP